MLSSISPSKAPPPERAEPPPAPAGPFCPFPPLGLQTAFASAALQPDAHLLALEPLASSTPALAAAGSAAAADSAFEAALSLPAFPTGQLTVGRISDATSGAVGAAADATAPALAAERSLSLPAMQAATLLTSSRTSDAASDAVGAAAATATALAAALSHKPVKQFGLCSVEWDVLRAQGSLTQGTDLPPLPDQFSAMRSRTQSSGLARFESSGPVWLEFPTAS